MIDITGELSAAKSDAGQPSKQQAALQNRYRKEQWRKSIESFEVRNLPRADGRDDFGVQNKPAQLSDIGAQFAFHSVTTLFKTTTKDHPNITADKHVKDISRAWDSNFLDGRDRGEQSTAGLKLQVSNNSLETAPNSSSVISAEPNAEEIIGLTQAFLQSHQSEMAWQKKNFMVTLGSKNGVDLWIRTAEESDLSRQRLADLFDTLHSKTGTKIERVFLNGKIVFPS